MSEPPVAKKKRKKSTNLRLKTLEWLRARGWVGDSVERRSRMIAIDYMGFADIVVIKRGRAPLAVQVFRMADRSAHKEKLCRGIVVERKVKGVVTKVLSTKAPDGCRAWILNGGMVLLFPWELRKVLNSHRRLEGRATWTVVNLEWLKMAPDLKTLVVVPVPTGEGAFA